MKSLDTLTITEKGQAQFPASWRKQAGLMHGGPCDVRVLHDGRQSLSFMATKLAFDPMIPI